MYIFMELGLHFLHNDMMLEIKHRWSAHAMKPVRWHLFLICRLLVKARRSLTLGQCISWCAHLTPGSCWYLIIGWHC